MQPTHYEVVSSVLRRVGVDLDVTADRIFRPLGTPLVRKRVVVERHPMSRSIESTPEDDWQVGMWYDELQTLTNFALAGKKVFNVSKNLTHLLLNTDLKVQKRFLKFPFPCFFLRFEDAPVWITFGEEKKRLAGCYVTHMVDENAGRRQELAKFYFCTYAEKEDPFLATEGGRAVGSWLPLGDLGDDFVLTDKYIDEWHLDMMKRDNDAVYGLLMRLAVNVILYVNSAGADVSAPIEARGRRLLAKAMRQKKEKHRQRFLEEAARHSSLDYIDVGRHAKSLVSVPEQRRSGRTWTLTYKLLVRGHWKRVRKLKGHLTEEEKKAVAEERGDYAMFWKFIEPYEKGRDLSEALNKQYRVGGPE